MLRLFRLLAAVAALLPCAAGAATPVPIAKIGVPLGDGPPASLLRPAALRAVFRLPAADTALYLAANWDVRDVRVDVVAADGTRRTIVADTTLPGHMLGIRLPAESRSAARLEMTAHVVSHGGMVYLLRAEKLATIAWRNWWYAAFFGLFLGFALVHGILAMTLRSTAYGWYAMAMAADAFATLDHLGIVRPPPEISQPLQGAVTVASVAGIALFTRAFGGGRLPRALGVLLWGGAAAVVAIQIGSNLAGDFWPIPDLAGAIATLPLSVAIVTTGVLAARRGTDGARYFVAGAVCAAAGNALSALVNAVPSYNPLFELAWWFGAGLEAIFLALALSAQVRRGERERARLDRLAHIDGLTAIANRGAFEAALALEWERAGRTRAPLAALMIDVDAFKPYNDAYGHPAGDAALRRVAAALAAVGARRGDLVARYGGEEFVLLLPATALDAARARAEEARAAIAALAIAHDASPVAPVVTVSVGVAALVPDAASSAAELVARADAALYAAKAAGRDRVAADLFAAHTPIPAGSAGPSTATSSAGE